MVRNLVGTLLEVGLGRRPSDSIPELLEIRDRRWAGPTAPAAGLTLVRVDY
jgi:tRNA pseudouridine38-40 synthase